MSQKAKILLGSLIVYLITYGWLINPLSRTNEVVDCLVYDASPSALKVEATTGEHFTLKKKNIYNLDNRAVGDHLQIELIGGEPYEANIVNDEITRRRSVNNLITAGMGILGLITTLVILVYPFGYEKWYLAQ